MISKLKAHLWDVYPGWPSFAKKWVLLIFGGGIIVNIFFDFAVFQVWRSWGETVKDIHPALAEYDTLLFHLFGPPVILWLGPIFLTGGEVSRFFAYCGYGFFAWIMFYVKRTQISFELLWGLLGAGAVIALWEILAYLFMFLTMLVAPDPQGGFIYMFLPAVQLETAALFFLLFLIVIKIYKYTCKITIPRWIKIALSLLFVGAIVMLVRMIFYSNYESIQCDADNKPTGLSGDIYRDMVLVPAGEFWMGAVEGDKKAWPGEYPRHKVYLDAFYMDKYEVTAAQFKRFACATGRSMRKQPSWSSNNHPVVDVNWYDADAYCKWAGKRLPTEAEWEKSARGGNDTKYGIGDDASKLRDYEWLGGAPYPYPTYQVGQKKASGYGLYDINGNVCEWVFDWFNWGRDRNYYKYSPEKNPQGPKSGKRRGIRGCDINNYTASDCRISHRYGIPPRRRENSLGFRCAYPKAGMTQTKVEGISYVYKNK